MAVFSVALYLLCFYVITAYILQLKKLNEVYIVSLTLYIKYKTILKLLYI